MNGFDLLLDAKVCTGHWPIWPSSWGWWACNIAVCFFLQFGVALPPGTHKHSSQSLSGPLLETSFRGPRGYYQHCSEGHWSSQTPLPWQSCEFRREWLMWSMRCTICVPFQGMVTRQWYWTTTFRKLSENLKWVCSEDLFRSWCSFLIAILTTLRNYSLEVLVWYLGKYTYWFSFGAFRLEDQNH